MKYSKGRIQYVSDIFKEDTQNDHRSHRSGQYRLQAQAGDVCRHHDPPQSPRSGFGLARVAILDDKDLELVFVRRGDEYVPLIVETGIRQGDYVQIVSGIQEGDVVVTNGNFQLKSKMYEDVVVARGTLH